MSVPDWSPFRPAGPGEDVPKPRGIGTPEGLGDRLRTAAFAERQAREAFDWAAASLADAPAGLPAEWRRLAREEDKHLGWLLARMSELGVGPAARPVSTRLWESLQACRGAREFTAFMVRAEERGRAAEASFARALASRDPVTADIFARIAREEEGHIALPTRYYPELHEPAL